MNQDVKEIYHHFCAEGSWLNGNPAGSGHIHGTWLIRTIEKDKPDYILQQINHHVFPAVPEMMENIRKVTSHIKKKRRDAPQGDLLEIIHTIDGKSYYTSPEGDYWRMYRKLEPGLSYDIVPGSGVAREAGKAFGQFIDDLSDMNPDELFPVIPDFHSIVMRFGKFNAAVEADPCGRAAGTGKEISFALEAFERLKVIAEMEKQGKIPVRITHNDTKLNNVLFGHDGKAVCVIDLDTVMPGLSLYDFGDSIRTVTNTSLEDEADLKKVQFDIGVFKAYTEGFLEKTSPLLAAEELQFLPLSAQYMTYIMGIRFLTDYLEGDIYYRIKDATQNLRRCRTQFRLMECLSDACHECIDIVNQTFEKHKSATGH